MRTPKRLPLHAITGVITIFLALLGSELLASIYFFSQTGQLFWSRTHAEIISTNKVAEDTRQKLSPIYGYNLRPGWDAKSSAPPDLGPLGYSELPDFWSWPANNYGFFSKIDYPFNGPQNTYYVAVVGGSVANGFALEAREQLIQVVSKAGSIPSEAVQIINLTGGGFKQPQQALIIAYFAAIGQKFDLIINLDGLNEAYIGWDNSNRFGAEPALPSVQFLYGLQNNFLSVNNNNQTKPAAIYKEMFALRRRAISTMSPLIYYYTQFVLARLRVEVVKTEAELGLPVEGRVYPFMIQKRNFASDNELANHLADTWVRGSLALSALATQVGAAYVHGLQPNQYYGRRVFSSSEEKLAFSNPSWEGGSIVPVVYKKMLERKKLLRDKGVNFLDLTAAFDDEKRQLYFDACCHFNHFGYEILMSGDFRHAIADAVRRNKHFKRNQTSAEE